MTRAQALRCLISAAVLAFSGCGDDGGDALDAGAGGAGGGGGLMADSGPPPIRCFRDVECPAEDYCQIEGAGPGACAPGCRTAPDNCPRGFDCQPEQRQCVNDCQCEPGAVTGCDGDALRVCSGDCYRFERRGCPEGQVCRQAECVNRPAPDAAPPAPDMAPAMDMAAADMAPADMLPADMAPADMTPADMMPADMMPVDMAPADMMPVDMASPDAGPAAQ